MNTFHTVSFLVVGWGKLVRQTLHAALLGNPDINDAESLVRGDFLTSHPACLRADSTTLEAVNVAAEHVERLVVMTRQNDVGLLATLQAFDELLQLVRSRVSGAIVGVKELHRAVLADFDVSFPVSEMVVVVAFEGEQFSHRGIHVGLVLEEQVVVAQNRMDLDFAEHRDSSNRKRDLSVEADGLKLVDVPRSAAHPFDNITRRVDGFDALIFEVGNHLAPEMPVEVLRADMRVGEISEAHMLLVEVVAVVRHRLMPCTQSSQNHFLFQRGKRIQRFFSGRRGVPIHLRGYFGH